MDTMLTLDDIDAAEGAVKNVRVKLQAIGREIYKMREGETLEPHYAFYAYHRENFCGSNYMNQEGPDWGVGTPILSLIYYWSRAENHITVTFPQRWLTQDWRTLEQDRLTAERDAEAKQKMLADKDAGRLREELERRTFEQLKAKYDTPATHHKGSSDGQ